VSIETLNIPDDGAEEILKCIGQKTNTVYEFKYIEVHKVGIYQILYLGTYFLSI
jgi:hypothetical protein